MEKKKIKIKIRSLKESFKEAREVASEIDRGIFKKHTPVLGFEDFNTYKKILTEKRLELLGIIKTKKPKSIKELSNISHRDFKNVYEDIKMLKALGLVKLKKSANGIAPFVIYDEINIDIKIPLEAISS